MATTIGFERFGVLPIEDPRIPYLPNDAYLEECLKTKYGHPRTHDYAYPSPFPPGMSTKKISFAGDMNAINRNGEIWRVNAVYHARRTVSIVSNEAIVLGPGSIIVAPNISLKAPIIEIFDSLESAIRTTVVAKNSLTIEANAVLIDGADVFSYSGFVDMNLTVRNVTALTERWLQICDRAQEENG